MKKNAGYFYKENTEDNSTTVQAQWAAVVTVLSVLVFHTAMIIGFYMAQTSQPPIAPLPKHEMEEQRFYDRLYTIPFYFRKPKRRIPPPGISWPGL